MICERDINPEFYPERSGQETICGNSKNTYFGSRLDRYFKYLEQNKKEGVCFNESFE